MFGVVPRVLWERQSQPDELNRIPMSMRALLAVDRSAGRVILVDSGAGDKWTPDEIERFAFEFEGDQLGAGLGKHGLSDDDVTDVIITHLHFDHNGGLTRWADPDTQRATPRFRKARHWLHAGHYAHATAPTPKDRASFYQRDIQPVAEAGLLEVVEGDDPKSPIPNVSWFLANGHTPYQLLPRFFDDQTALQYLADLIPTVAHLPIPWVMAYDNEPLKTMTEKQQILRACAEQNLMLFFEHDPLVAAARIDTAGKHARLGEAVEC
jgi:glyoxylase-like metal-dependent hydrolase (beta-lactamase superfamily II)